MSWQPIIAPVMALLPIMAMDMRLDLEAQIPNRCEVHLNSVLPCIELKKAELKEGIVQEDLLTLSLNYNRFEPFALIIGTANEMDQSFYFENQESKEHIEFFLLQSESMKTVKPGDTIYQREQIEAPIEEAMSLSIAIPENSHKYLENGKYRTQFKVTMKTSR